MASPLSTLLGVLVLLLVLVAVASAIAISSLLIGEARRLRLLVAEEELEEDLLPGGRPGPFRLPLRGGMLV